MKPQDYQRMKENAELLKKLGIEDNIKIGQQYALTDPLKFRGKKRNKSNEGHVGRAGKKKARGWKKHGKGAANCPR